MACGFDPRYRHQSSASTRNMRVEALCFLGIVSRVIMISKFKLRQNIRFFSVVPDLDCRFCYVNLNQLIADSFPQKKRKISCAMTVDKLNIIAAHFRAVLFFKKVVIGIAKSSDL